MWYFINRFFKRFFDIFLSLLALIILLPFFLIIALAIKINSKGPVFFKQERRTKNGRIFKMYKFRSMVVNAESMGAGLFNYENDPRVTKVGRFLRKTSLDELPQLWNVLKGDISLVGPRPSVTYELGDYDTLNSKYKKRFTMRGGITGLAQIKGRNENCWDEKVTYDNQYVDSFKKQGCWLDIKILFGTVFKVFKKADIYEEKQDENMSDEESAKAAEEEIIRIAHLPDEEEPQKEIEK
ncbi:MAG: sugar transferase [Clostridiales bacterium]|nr:sugar transferase [Clostridiales bacterium]